MANQAIALQARAPQQGNFLAPAIQQAGQMANRMAQQQALDRQTAVAQQAMEVERAKEGRAVAGEERAAAKFKVDQDALIYAKHRQYAPAVIQGGASVYQQWLENVAQDNPQAAQIFESAMPAANFDKDAFTRMVGTMDQNFEARYGKAITKELITPEGGVMGANISGLPGATYAVPIPDISRPLAPTAPAAGAPPMAPRQTPTAQPASQTPTPTGGMFQPISVTGGQPQGADPQAALLASLTEAKQTGQIGADVVEQLRQLGGPQAAPAVDAFLAQNNIKVAPGGGMRSAVYRGESPMAAQQVQYNPNAYAPVRVKNPMVSPLPGSASVPLPRVAAEARAGRQTPEEAAAVASATATATKTAELKAEQAKKLPAKRQVDTLLTKIRNAYETLNKAEAIPSSARGAGANVMDYLATTGMGREAQRALGTKANTSLNEITGSRKLLATAIKNATGMSAQEMNSNVELQLTLDALTDPTQGYESAISQLDTISELYGTGKTAAKTPTVPVLTPEQVRANPNVKRWQTTDGRIMTRP